MLEKCEKNSLLESISPSTYLQLETIGHIKSIKIIEVKIEFVAIGEVDTMNEKYQAQVKIKSKWVENEIIDEYDPDEHWNPKLFIENAFHDLKEEIHYKATKYDDKRTLITETRISKGSFCSV